MSSRPPSRSDQPFLSDNPHSRHSKIKTQNSKLAFVCVGAGRGERFGGDKLVEMLGSRTVLETALVALQRAAPDALMVVVVTESRLRFWRGLLATGMPMAHLVVGGSRRQESVRAGVLYAAHEGAEVAAIHDAARPLVDARDVRAVIGALRGDAEGAILTERVADTVKRVDGNDTIVETIPRERVRLAQTPQVFRISRLMEVWRRANSSEDWTDEATLLESAGFPVRTVLALHPNPKLTTAADLRVVRAMAETAS